MRLPENEKAFPFTILHDRYRVGGTRIPLDTVVYHFNQGCTPEEIVIRFPTLKLGDVYAAIAYYLHHREAVEAYIKEQEKIAEEVRERIEREFPSAGIRERLLARRAQMEAEGLVAAGR